MSLNLTKKLEHFLAPSGASRLYMYGYLFLKKLVLISRPSGLPGPHIHLSRSY